MREFRPFTEKTFSVGAQYDTDFIGRGVAAIGIRLDMTTTGNTTSFDDAAARMLGTPEVVQAEEPLIRMEGADWFHIAALSSGGYDKILNADTAGASAVEAVIDFENLMPGAAINAGSNRVFLRGTFGALADYGS